MTRLEKLKWLENELQDLMGKANSRTYAGLARQYRETIREIEEIEGIEDDTDDIAELLSKRKTDGKAGTVR